jgi:diguanylate cyclase (GGDEF)-like protein/PAS domain S-box-containing protein
VKDLKKTKIQLVSELEPMRQRVAQLEQTERSLEERRRFARLVAESITDSVWLMDMNLKTIYISPRSQRLQGYTFEEFSNLPSEKLMTPASVKLALNAFTEEMEKVRKGPKDLVISRTLELENYRRDGSTFWTESTFTLIRDENGEPTGILGVGRDITEHKQAEEALKQSEEKYRTILDETDDIYFEVDLRGNFTFANDAACRNLGYSRSEITGMSFRTYTAREDAEAVFKACHGVYLTGKPVKDVFFKVSRKDGSPGIAHTSFYPLKNEEGKVIGFRGIGRDVTERRRLEEALVRSEERYRNSLENMQDSYFEVDLAGNFTFVNDATCLNLGYPREDLVGNNFRIIMSENEAKAVFQAYHTVYLSGEPNKGFAFEVRRKDGTTGFAESSITLLKNELGETVGFRCVGRDVTERKQMEQKLAEMATHDFLTGLPNRVLLVDRFAVAAALAHRKNNRLAVMSLDLDRFKPINDTLGHSAGDQVLKGVSMRLTSIIRASDTVARVGGDEFILVMLETNLINDATAIAQKILDSFKEPFIIDGHELNISTSIGIAVYPEDGQDLETVMKKSDAAMYYAKGHGRSQFKFFGDGDVRIGGKHKSV